MFPYSLVVIIFGIVSSAEAIDCSKNYFEVVNVLTNKNDTGAKVTTGNMKDMQAEETIIVTATTIPVLCEDAITGYPNLQTLHLSMLEIQDVLPGSFRDLPKLRELSLRMNNLEAIEEGIFNDLPLESLDLSGNVIAYIQESSFDNMVHLKMINLSHNKIKKLKKNWFHNTKSLTKLLFNNNLLVDIQKKAFKNVESSPNLVINLSDNKIKFIAPKAFVNFKEGQINLNFNELDSLPSMMFGNNKGGMFDLFLQNNSISCLSYDVYTKVFMNCRRVVMIGNPITCSCSKEIELFFNRRGQNTMVFYEIDENCQVF